MLRFYSLAVVILFFLTVNFYLIVRLLLVSPEASAPAPEVASPVGGVDGIALQSLQGENEVLESGRVQFTGTAVIVNAQGVPVPGAVVTLQHVGPAGPFIDQFVAAKDGVAEVQFVWEGLGAYRIEVLDVVGDGYKYAPQLNEVRVITGRAVAPTPLESE